MQYRFDPRSQIHYVTEAMVLDEHGQPALDNLRTYMAGQTIGLAQNGDFMIFAWDYESWRSGAPVLD